MEGQRGRLTRLAAALVVVSLAGVVTACGPGDASPTRTVTVATETPTNTGTPTPTPLTEEEAYAAAEATYRAYIDAFNAVDLSDTATFDPYFDLTTAELRETSEEELEALRSAGYVKSGDAVVSVVQPYEWDAVGGIATIDVCLDVSEVDFTDAAGVSLVKDTREDVQRLRVSATMHQGRTLLNLMSGRSDGLAC